MFSAGNEKYAMYKMWQAYFRYLCGEEGCAAASGYLLFR